MSTTNMLKLKSGRKFCYLTNEGIENELITKGLSNKLNIPTDLETGVYEGGLKIWECSIDLCNFIDSISFEGFNVLELGCGAGLPSIVAALNGATSLTLQDFNDYVLETCTKRNFQLNGIDLEKCFFIASDWNNCEELKNSKKFDIILTSETIYNENNYIPLLNLMNELLAINGEIYLAAKSYYFGVGGSIDSFKKLIQSKGIFNCQEVWKTTKSSVERRILKMTRI
ncbi:hypothetical protein Mgra_00008195 [Meloidogyne graminicola]|uniref:protein-histidine N-methyltransferase n=1 Tax=Meloidogyne graminicola TaxID=189291 RepID=A0A8S9ZGK8_9BILA|nr:hypothetical protein Mgra_00008195 [Meloidogyne graminicola]